VLRQQYAISDDGSGAAVNQQMPAVPIRFAGSLNSNLFGRNLRGKLTLVNRYCRAIVLVRVQCVPDADRVRYRRFWHSNLQAEPFQTDTEISLELRYGN
jgi:hypothetical protein